MMRAPLLEPAGGALRHVRAIVTPTESSANPSSNWKETSSSRIWQANSKHKLEAPQVSSDISTERQFSASMAVLTAPSGRLPSGILGIPDEFSAQTIAPF